MASAIGALVQWDGRPVSHKVMEATNRSVRSRYPDGEWIWVDGPVGMAQADLATLPEDAPGVASCTDLLRIVASCRLDNRSELQQALPAKSYPHSQTDAALILAAYQAWGVYCIDHLLGDFAFVLWDQERRRIFAARDLSGTRPLFYYADARRLFIASEHTQILQDPTIPLVVERAEVVEYFTPSFQWSSGWDQGMLQGFRPLPAGCTLLAEDGNVQVQPFWQWAEMTYDRRSEAELLEAYLDGLTTALQARLRSRRPVGFELSGGLDSTALVCLGQRRLNRVGDALTTFSLVFDETPEVNERSRIQAVIDSLGQGAVTPHFLNADGLFAPACLAPGWSPTSITAPQTLTLTLAHARLYARAAETGHGVLISGEMGDALNDGYPYFYLDLLQRGDLAALGRHLRLDWRRSRRATVRELLRHLMAWLMPLPLLRWGGKLYERRRPVELPLPTLLTPAVRQAVIERDRTIRQAQAQQVVARSPAQRELLTTFAPPMPYLSAPLGQPIERWHPYTDRRLLEFSLRLPPELKWEAEQAHYFLAARKHHRRALANILPKAILTDNLGVDFTPVFKRSLQQTDWRGWLQQSQVQVVEQGYIEASQFDAMLRPEADAPADFRAVLCLEAWLRAWLPGGAFQRLLPARQSA